MFLRIDKLPVELPASPDVDPIAARNVQELLGGRFGEMSTLMNYTYQSFAMRGRDAIRPYYALISNIARRFMEQGSHLKLYRFSPEDYREAGSIWSGAAPKAYAEGLGGSDQLEFVDAPRSRSIELACRDWRSFDSSLISINGESKAETDLRC
jgi:Mn-containing catalase